jgi:hypothetical protein
MGQQDLCLHDKGSWSVTLDLRGNWVLRLECEICEVRFDREIKWNEGTGTKPEREPTFDILKRLNWPQNPKA